MDNINTVPQSQPIQANPMYPQNPPRDNKKFIIILAISLVFIMLIIGYIIFRNLSSNTYNTNEGNGGSHNNLIPTSFKMPSSQPTIKINKINPTNDKIYLVINQDKSKTVTMDAPKNARVLRKKETGFIGSEIRIDDNYYYIIADDLDRGSPCAALKSEKICKSEVLKIQTAPPLTIGGFRIWQNSKGVFMLNPIDLRINDQSINHLRITTSGTFSDLEVKMWEDLLATIKIEE